MSSDNEYNYHHKSDLVRDAEGLARQRYADFQEWLVAKDEMQEIIADWKSTGSANCREARRYSDDPNWTLNSDFKSALDDFYSEGDRLRGDRENDFAERSADKDRLIERATPLQNWSNPHEAFKQFKIILDQFKIIGHSGDASDSQWQEMMTIGNNIKAKMGQNKKDVHAKAVNFEAVAVTKREIIKDLETALATARDFDKNKLAKEAQVRWKAAGSAGRAETELWDRFSKVVNEARKHAVDHGKKLAERADKKRQIIEDAEKILKSGDGWPAFRKLLEHWKTIGNCGREEADLWQKLNIIGDAIKDPSKRPPVNVNRSPWAVR